MINSIKQIIDNTDYGYYGLRVLPYGHESKYTVGDTLPNSFNWIDNVRTDDELDGVCAIGIRVSFDVDENDIIYALDSVKSAGYQGSVIALVASNRQQYGEDKDEVILENGQLIGIIHE